jgi:hypothetical protein
MSINNRLLVVLMIAAIWMIAATGMIKAVMDMGTSTIGLLHVMLAALLATVFTYGLLFMYDRGNSVVARNKRVNRIINRLDTYDLDLLRERLTAQEDVLFEPDQKQKRLYKESK